MNLYDSQQHLKYIVGLALQEATGGGESDKSTDVGKIVCGIIGTMAGPTTMFEEIYCTTFACEN